MPDADVILIVEPHPLPDPGTRSDVELPRKLHARAWPEDHARADLCTEDAQYPNAYARTDLPRISDEEQFTD
jgi:hypothetical protein